MSNSDQNDNSTTKNQKGAESAAMSSPTPGEVLQEMYEETSESGRINSTSPSSTPATPGEDVLEALQEQQYAMDTIRAGNHAHGRRTIQPQQQRQQHRPSASDVSSISNASGGLHGMGYSGNLEELFNAPFAASPTPRNETIEFQEFLLAEQEQQQAILQERQRKFEERDNQVSNENQNDRTSPVPPSSLSQKPAKSILKQHTAVTSSEPTSDNNQPVRPPPLNATSRATSSESSGSLNNPGSHSHNRTVSWSLDRLETFSPSSEQNQGSISNLPNPPNPRKPGVSNRPRLMSDENRISIRNLAGVMPFESEAETNILRAVDDYVQMNQATADRGGSETSTFFSNLPGDFTLPLEEEQPQQQEASPTSPGRSYHSQKPSDLTAGTVNRRGELSKNNTSARAVGLRRSVRNMTNTRPRAHRHTQSVEQTLFGLTAQMSKLDGDALKHIMDDDSGHNNKNGSRPTTPVDTSNAATEEAPKTGHRRAVSSAQRLAERAQVLVNQAVLGRHGRQASSLRDEMPRPLTPDDIESRPGSIDPATGYYNDSSNTSRGSSKNTNNNNNSIHELRNSSHSRISTGSPQEYHAPTIIDEGDDEDYSSDDEAEIVNQGNSSSRKSKWRKTKRRSGQLKEDWEMFNEFLDPRKKSVWVYCKNILLFILIPCTLISALFFYYVDGDMENDDPETASISWWILFIGVRQVLTLSLAMATQSFLIDFLLLGSRLSLRLMGPIITLFLVQSKGWPCIAMLWAIIDFAVLCGNNPFAEHWLFWQEYVGLFNAQNPSGTITGSQKNVMVLTLLLVVGFLVSLKRLVVGLFLGRQTFVHYGEELAKVMKRMVLVSEVASLSRLPPPVSSRDLFRTTSTNTRATEWLKKQDIATLITEEEGSTDTDECNVKKPDTSLHLTDLTGIGEDLNHTLDGNGVGRKQPTKETGDDASAADIRQSLSGENKYAESDRRYIMDLLEQWEEPERGGRSLKTQVTLGAVLQFRQSLTLLKRRYPFSAAFGPSDTREVCIESAQDVFDQLLLRDMDEDEEDLHFDVLAALATGSKGEIDELKLLDLIKVFRPDRDGRLSRLAFVKSIDTVYKRMRLLSANIHNSSLIDNAVENIINIGFYFLIGLIVLAGLGLNPMQIFLSLSTFIVAFSFMVSTASARYFEGILLILMQRPFGVGDRIHVSNSEVDLSPDGSAGWIVEDVNLFHTTVCYGTTNERATVSNGTLAHSRIINAARSPHAVVYVNLKFGIDIPYDRIQIFQSAVEAHVKARPREWLGFLGFRAGGISVDRGFIEYKIVVQHREPWQNVVTILESKARLTSYCLEVAKQLKMRYSSPPLPVDLNVVNTNSGSDQLLMPQLQMNSKESIEKTA